jgi:uncharacterized protein YecT (DUF1311 family)
MLNNAKTRTALLSSSLSMIMLLSVTQTVDADSGDTRGLRSRYSECISGDAMSTAGALQCAHDEFAFQDARLNAAYRKLMSALSDAEKATLRSQERQWLVSKKKHCALPADAGTTDQVTSADCEVTETAQRANYLENRLHE